MWALGQLFPYEPGGTWVDFAEGAWDIIVDGNLVQALTPLLVTRKPNPVPICWYWMYDTTFVARPLMNGPNLTNVLAPVTHSLTTWAAALTAAGVAAPADAACNVTTIVAGLPFVPPLIETVAIVAPAADFTVNEPGFAGEP
jgi:Na+/phosphate symporter